MLKQSIPAGQKVSAKSEITLKMEDPSKLPKYNAKPSTDEANADEKQETDVHVNDVAGAITPQ